MRRFFRATRSQRFVLGRSPNGERRRPREHRIPSFGRGHVPLQAIDHPTEVVGTVDDAGGGDLIDAAEISGDGGLGFDFGVGAEGSEGIPRSGT